MYYKCMLWFADNFVNHNVNVWMYECIKWNVVYVVLVWDVVSNIHFRIIFIHGK